MCILSLVVIFHGLVVSPAMVIKLNYFDPANSSTSSVVPCSHHNCAICSTNNNCSFDIEYEDGGRTSDLMHVSNISKGPLTSNFSVPLVFGCSNLRTG
ncbi:putative aspartic peptidase domain-containing protein [Lupinus albus]|uniref:Putative aspartic peptidase domain-containing protein n=1 Tax=Lupinus albus TaxID=3870 RepID=A0A6A4Q3V0_LUPAL|nr:putative aspartic peptidase domain-containing protein [Lupinus albus]